MRFITTVTKPLLRITNGFAQLGQTEGISAANHYQTSVIVLTVYSSAAAFCYALSAAAALRLSKNFVSLLG